MTKIPVNISVTSKSLSSEEEPVTVEAVGERYVRDNGTFLKYEHRDDDGNLIKSLITIKKGSLKNHESGAVEATMQFVTGETTPFLYKSMYGTVPLAIRTHLYASEMTPTSISAKVRYDLISGDELVAERLLTIRAEDIR